MRIVVSANGADLDAPASPMFGRCPVYVFVDTDTMEFEAIENPAIAAAGGAGIQAAQFVVERGAQAVVTGNVGPNAFNVLQSANVPVLLFGGGTVRDAVEGYRQDRLSATGGASARAHAGMGMGMGRGMSNYPAQSPPYPQQPDPVNVGSEKEALTQQLEQLERQLREVKKRLEELR